LDSIGSIKFPLFEKIEARIKHNTVAKTILKNDLNLFLLKNLVINHPINEKKMKKKNSLKNTKKYPNNISQKNTPIIIKNTFTNSSVNEL